MSEEPKKEFLGIWLTKDILDHPDLTLAEKLLVAYTRSFPKGCFASDAHMGKVLGKSEKTISNMLTSLRKKGYMSGRDFPKSGTQTSRNPGTGLPVNREHRYKVEESIEMKKNNAATPGHFVPDSEDAVRVLVSVVVDRGFAEADVRRELDIMLKEVRAGITVPPGNWAAYLAARCHKEIGKRKRAARAAPPPPKPTSQFSVVHT